MTGYCKVGFHAGVGGNRSGIGDYMRRLDSAGIPFCVKSVHDVGLAVEAAEYARRSGVKHNIVLRFTNPGGAANDEPDLNLAPEEAAEVYWQQTKRSIPPEFEPYREHVWIEMTNELDKSRCDWLGFFGHHLGGLALADGYRVALFGMNAGEPEPEHWATPGMQLYLRDCAANPERLAVTLHEGKLAGPDGQPGMHSNASDFYPHLIGRFQWLFAICDRSGIDRPTVFISEWAWKYDDMPHVGRAMQDVVWLSELVARFPSVRGVFLWNLTGGSAWADLPDQLQRMIRPVTEYALQARFPDPVPPTKPEPPPYSTEPSDGPEPEAEPVRRGDPRVQYRRVYQVLWPDLSDEQAVEIFRQGWREGRRTTGASFDDGGIGDLDWRIVEVFGCPPEKQQDVLKWYREHYWGVTVHFREAV